MVRDCLMIYRTHIIPCLQPRIQKGTRTPSKVLSITMVKKRLWRDGTLQRLPYNIIQTIEMHQCLHHSPVRSDNDGSPVRKDMHKFVWSL